MKTLVLIVVSFVVGATLFGAPRTIAESRKEYKVLTVESAITLKLDNVVDMPWDKAVGKAMTAYANEGWQDIQVDTVDGRQCLIMRR
jgi:hypothetical protein